MADAITFEGDVIFDRPFLGQDGQPSLPFAQALLDLADSQYGFSTAAEAPDPGDVHEARFRALEASVAEMSKGISALVAATKPPAAAATAKPKPRKPPVEGSVPGTPVVRGRAPELSGLEPAVVRSAAELNEILGPPA